MKKHNLVFRLTILLFFFSTVFLTHKTYANITDAEKSRISHQAAKLQIPFILNQGQTDEDVKFYAKAFGGTVFITKHGEIVYALPDSEKAIAIKEEFIDGKLNEINGEEKSITKVSYFRDNDPSNWNNNISTFNIVNLGEIYEGIELKLKAYGNNVEKLFFIKPEKNPEAIKIGLKGAKGLKVNEKGELEVKTELGTIKFTKPVAYQVIDGKKAEVAVNYDLNPIPPLTKGDKGGFDSELIYSFKVGDYDKTKELVIDPLLASTFLGGGDYDYYGWNYTSKVIAIDQQGNVYVTGISRSGDFPTTAGAYASTYNNLGGVYHRQRRLDDAIKEYLTTLELSPDFADAHNNLGLAYSEQGRFDEAINEFMSALKLKPNYAEAHSNLGMVYYKQGMLDKAVDEYLTALKLHPNDAKTHNNLGIVYSKQERFDEAIKEFSIALELNPNFTMARNNLWLAQNRIKGW